MGVKAMKSRDVVKTGISCRFSATASAVVATFALALLAPASADDKPLPGEKTAKRAAKFTEKTAKRAAKFTEKTARRAGKAVERTADKVRNAF